MPPSWLCLMYTPACISRKLSLLPLDRSHWLRLLPLPEQVLTLESPLSATIAILGPSSRFPGLLVPILQTDHSPSFCWTQAAFVHKLYPLMAVSTYPRDLDVGRLLIMSVVQKNARGKLVCDSNNVDGQ